MRIGQTFAILSAVKSGAEDSPEGMPSGTTSPSTQVSSLEPSGDSSDFTEDDVRSLAARFRRARERVNCEPSEAQQEAGNYRKGHVIWKGFDLTIENPKGSKRCGVSASGKEWETLMTADYGYFKGTEARDGDHLDFFMGPDHDSDYVLVINQVRESGRFDEHKVILGCRSEAEARALYLSHYEKGWKGLGSCRPMTLDQFRTWMKGDITKQAREGQTEVVSQEDAERVVEEARRLATSLRPMHDELIKLSRSGPRVSAWYSPSRRHLVIDLAEPAHLDIVHEKYAHLAEAVWVTYQNGPPRYPDDWVGVGRVETKQESLLKESNIRPILRGLGWVPGGSGLGRIASPMTAMLATGLLGAGAGYGTGKMLEGLLPERWERGRLSGTLAMLGGLGGAGLPALVLGLPNVDQGKGLMDSPVLTGGGEDKVWVGDDGQFRMSNPESRAGIPPFAKESFETGLEGPPPEVDVDSFLHTMWHDPNVADRVSPEIRAATTGLLRGAQPAGQRSVGMLDLGRLTAGIGTGWAAGALVGKALGTLVGMPDSTQQKLREIGVWAGVLNSVIPRAYGG